MGLFSKIFGKSESESGGDDSALRQFIGEALPKHYVQSKKYAVSVQGGSARIVLDMLADGSNFNNFGDQDLVQLAEFESSYLLTECLANPPEPVDFILEMDFSGGRSAAVERKPGAATGTLTYRGKQREIRF